MSAPQVAGVAGMMYSVNKNITAEQVKKYIVEASQSETISGYGLLNAYEAVRKAYYTPSVGIEDDDDGMLMGRITNRDNENLENVNVNVFEFDWGNTNIPNSASKGELLEQYASKTNEFGEYVLRLESGKSYCIEFISDKYTTERILLYMNRNQFELHEDIIMNPKEDISVCIVDNNQQPVDSALVQITSELNDNNSADWNGTYLTQSEDGSFVYYVDSNNSDFEPLQSLSDTNGNLSALVDVGKYNISVEKYGYLPENLKIEVSNNQIYDQSGNPIERIMLTPIETSITGTVTEYNTTTGVTRPLAAHGVAVYQDGILAASAVTSSDGTYNIELNRQGDFIVDFGGDKQTDILINSNGEYTVNAVFEVCDEEDTDGGDTGGDGEDDNEDDGDDEDDDSGNTEETDDVIIDIDIYDNTGIDPNDEGYTGNNAVSGGNFADGVTIRSKDGSYINIYYDGSYCNVWINAQSHIWFYTYGALKYDKFDANGNLISSGVIDSWLMDAMYYDTTLVYKTYITGIKITAYSDRIRVDYTYHKEQKYYGGLGDLLGESYDRSSYQNIMR